MKNNNGLSGVLRWLGAAFVCVGLQANAIPITGEIHFVGVFNPVDGSGISSLGDATGIDFSNPTIVGAVSGTYQDAGVAAWADTAVMNDFTFDPTLDPNPVTLWSLSHGSITFSFELNNITVDLQSDTQLNLSGTGVLRGTGYEETAGTWNFQGGGGAFFTFRADTGSSDTGGGSIAVPDSGAAIGLLGIALSLLFFSTAKPLARKKD